MDNIFEYLQQARDISVEWLTSPAAYAQFGILVGSYILAVVVAKKLSKALTQVLSPAEDSQTNLSKLRRYSLTFLPLLLPLLAYGFTAGGEQATVAMFGAGEVIAFGKRVFLFLAARVLVRDIINDPFLKVIGKFFLIPIMAIYALGLLDQAFLALEAMRVSLGNISFSALTILKALIAGSILFWLGRWSNDRGAEYIRAQEMRAPTRELATKAFELAVYGTVFLLLMNILGLNMSTLAVLGGAIGVGIGFGLQQIASNFISGIILLLEGQATVGDYVELDGGEAGRIVKMMSRATILETFDGKWIVVPNEHFITTRIVNYSDSGSANRLECEFSVSYETDINLIPDIVEKAVAAHPGVLSLPELPDCELRGFGDSGIDFAVEFWVEGIDDGKNKYSSDVLFLIWNALKDNNIEIPFPQRELRMRDPEVRAALAASLKA